MRLQRHKQPWVPSRLDCHRNYSPMPRVYFPAVTTIRRRPMLGWALTFLVIALIAALLGFGGIAGVAVEAAKLVFFVAIVLFAISAVFALLRGRSPTVP